ncbi:arginyl-tRNA--protein transferase 1 [Selaginella moellendorffii]|uniref:arginyl-tRNA--protein transferase 1 n=1 Tax=Selaginella moellendorffii TaxID=88036 RepID=UPI000D1C9766|nr:arginyl-tRNA--protein transferase 1 [Selaginella moellendorffii]|eukprot:XP_024529360.1 arginyl-tRNA--protein transferase 1 [Selaginella moellendorffii]
MAASSSSSSGSSDGGGASGRRAITSIVDDQGVYSSRCGYCKSERMSSVAHGMAARRLHVNDYQELLDRGWRRSGSFLYKPEGRTCCPPYTIRLKVDAFVPSKEQIRVRRRMNRYLEGDCIGKDDDASKGTISGMETGKEEDGVSAALVDSLKAAIRDWMVDAGVGSDFQVPDVGVRRISEKVRKKLQEGSTSEWEASYTSNAAFLVASALKKRRNLDGGQLAMEVVPADLASQLAAKLSAKQLSGVVVKACKGHVNFYLSSSAKGKSSVAAIHGETKAGNGDGEAPVHRVKRTLEVRMQRSAFDRESFELYKKYQVLVHNDKQVLESSYRRFLVDSPLLPFQSASTSYGSFHQQYRIDGRLVAVGVVDILPKCLSSKYLFWDPDFAFLSLGKFSALQEIEWVKAAAEPSLQYYYLGYYIHSCPKMRYKAAYAPAELLCPLTLKWIPFGIARPLVETGAFVRLSGENKQADITSNGTEALELHETPKNLGEVPIVLYSSGRCILLKDLELAAPKRFIEGLKWQLLQYWQLVGEGLASRMAYAIQSKFS